MNKKVVEKISDKSIVTLKSEIDVDLDLVIKINQGRVIDIDRGHVIGVGQDLVIDIDHHHMKNIGQDRKVGIALDLKNAIAIKADNQVTDREAVVALVVIQSVRITSEVDPGVMKEDTNLRVSHPKNETV